MSSLVGAALGLQTALQGSLSVLACAFEGLDADLNTTLSGVKTGKQKPRGCVCRSRLLILTVSPPESDKIMY